MFSRHPPPPHSAPTLPFPLLHACQPLLAPPMATYCKFPCPSGVDCPFTCFFFCPFGTGPLVFCCLFMVVCFPRVFSFRWGNPPLHSNYPCPSLCFAFSFCLLLLCCREGDRAYVTDALQSAERITVFSFGSPEHVLSSWTHPNPALSSRLHPSCPAHMYMWMHMLCEKIGRFCSLCVLCCVALQCMLSGLEHGTTPKNNYADHVCVIALFSPFQCSSSFAFFPLLPFTAVA